MAHRLTLLRQRQIAVSLPVAPPVTIIEGTAAVLPRSSASRMVNKLRLLKGGSVPTFLVLDRCCTTSLPWTLEWGRRGSQAILGIAGQCNNFSAPWQCLNFLPEPQRHGSLRSGTSTL